MDRERALLDLLDLAPGGGTPGRGEGVHFVGRPPLEQSVPVYGGHLAAQALAAAGRTVPAALPAHSVHCSFLRPTLPSAPFEYRVEKVRNSASFATRRVHATQHGLEVFDLTASFHRPGPGLDHQDPMPPVPDPESLPTYEERLTTAFGEVMQPLGKPYELRFVGPLSFDTEKNPSLSSPRTRVWVRAEGELPDETAAGGARLLHACLLVYVCDVTMLETVLVRHGISWFHADGRSVDYTVWIHRPFRADDWLLCALETPAASGGRGLVLGRVFTRAGVLVATLAQEGLIRVSAGHGALG
ncbi:acyl-CoA thioesterase [Streptomyces albireticuli]|uniref:Acyl-CoA thioesterase II n=1 Tax=Streptomyces albireticuli TaxID=1940 RepID=A0A2A2D208_9ACTN|nr:acyl-CoA thioesterase domain-containing protein [Streptomyces albireticuli]MCD9195252.1 thioesterase family protein [Streptomyces albireticuli]PAU45555.1 acyl-CoA thioesterase II [Streptomyces albireticuli]